jgi:hypothetical protein
MLTMDAVPVQGLVTNAIRYWEPRRVLYNLVLLVVVAACFVVGLPTSRSVLSLDLALTLFVLAVVANVAYCAAYIVDIFAQTSGLREQWLKYRWTLFLIGIAFAGVLARFVSIGMFTGRMR